MRWTEERIDAMLKMLKDGYSFGLIAKEMGISRNAVIGKAHRLNAPANPQPDSINRKPQPKPAQKAKAPRRVPTKTRVPWNKGVKKMGPPKTPVRPDLPEPVSLDISAFDILGGQCRWPHGDGPFVFCGHPTFETFPYCEHHTARAYQPAKNIRSLYSFAEAA